jgi:hypothetical protein
MPWGSIPAASTIIGQAQLSVNKGSCAFLFCTDSLSWHEHGIVSSGKDVRGYFFGCWREKLELSGTAVLGS